MQVPFFRIRAQDAVRDPELYESFKRSAGKLFVFDAQPELCVNGTKGRSYQFPACGPEIYAYDPLPMLPVLCESDKIARLQAFGQHDDNCSCDCCWTINQTFANLAKALRENPDKMNPFQPAIQY